MSLALIITAAGSSTRFGCNIKKEYLPLPGENNTVLSKSLETFLKTKLFSTIVITLPQNNEKEAVAALNKSLICKDLIESKNNCTNFAFVSGGSTRQESVFCGLKKIAELSKEMPKAVLIHDGARPWVSTEVILDAVEKVNISGAAVPAIAVVDTQKQVAENGKITCHLKRETIVAVQTPQAFYFEQLLEAHNKAQNDGNIYTDDTEIWGKYCGDVFISKGDTANKKITYKEDI